MQTICDICGKHIKEVGRLLKHEISTRGCGKLRVCKKCKNSFNTEINERLT